MTKTDGNIEDMLEVKNKKIEFLEQKCNTLEFKLNVSNIRNKLLKEHLYKQNSKYCTINIESLDGIVAEIQNICSTFNLICNAYEIELEETTDIINKELNVKKNKLETELEALEKRNPPRYRDLQDFIDLDAYPSKSESTNIFSNIRDNNIFESKQLLTIKQMEECFEKSFKELKDSKQYVKHFPGIRSSRKQLLTSTTFKNYREILQNHFDTIMDYFKTRNITNETRAFQYIKKLFSNLELHLLSYGKYENYDIDLDEIMDLEKCLNNSIAYFSDDFKILDINLILDTFHSIGFCYFDLKSRLSQALVNPYGCHSYIYLPLKTKKEKTKENVLYSFYALEKVEKNKRYWILDCRLDDLSDKIINFLLPNLIVLYRQLYNHYFHDNDYRENLSFSGEGEQLLQNIMLLCNRYAFSDLLRGIVAKFMIYKPTKDDRFNMKSDDLQLKEQYIKRSDVECMDCVKQLFDNISVENCVKIYKEKLPRINI